MEEEGRGKELESRHGKIWIYLAVCRSKGKLRNLPSVCLPGTINSKNPPCLCPRKWASHFSVLKQALLMLKQALLMPEEYGDFLFASERERKWLKVLSYTIIPLWS